MPNYTNETPYTRTLDRFEYHLEDIDCVYCAHNRQRGGHGCGRSRCEYQDLRDECIAHNRIERKRGWFKCRE